MPGLVEQHRQGDKMELSTPDSALERLLNGWHAAPGELQEAGFHLKFRCCTHGVRELAELVNSFCISTTMAHEEDRRQLDHSAYQVFAFHHEKTPLPTGKGVWVTAKTKPRPLARRV